MFPLTSTPINKPLFSLAYNDTIDNKAMSNIFSTLILLLYLKACDSNNYELKQT